MKQRFLFLVAMWMTVFGISAQTATPPWTDRSSDFQTQTAVYAKVQIFMSDIISNDDGSTTRAPSYYDVIANLSGEAQIAAFVGDDPNPRQVIKVADAMKVENATYEQYLYDFRVGGTDADANKPITFKLYDPATGFVYPLQNAADAPVWNGDATQQYPSSALTLSFVQATSAKMQFKDNYPEDGLTIRKGDKINIWEYMDYEFYNPSGDVSVVENTPDPTWTENEGYTIDADGYLTALAPGVFYVNGNIIPGHSGYVLGFNLTILEEFVAIESLSVENMTVYKRHEVVTVPGPAYPAVVYNGGTSTPSYPNVTFTSSNEDVVQVIGTDNGVGLVAVGNFGETATVTATAVQYDEYGEPTDETVSTEFTVTVGSVIDAITVESAQELIKREADNVEFRLTPTISYINEAFEGEDASLVVTAKTRFYKKYTSTSSNPEVVQVLLDADGNVTGSYVALKGGTSTITFTNIYDPRKTATVEVVVEQKPLGLSFSTFDGEEVWPDTTALEAWVGTTHTVTLQVDPAEATVEGVKMSLRSEYDGTEITDGVEFGEAAIGDNGVITVPVTFSKRPYVEGQKQIQLYAEIYYGTEESPVEGGGAPMVVASASKRIRVFHAMTSISVENMQMYKGEEGKEPTVVFNEEPAFVPSHPDLTFDVVEGHEIVRVHMVEKMDASGAVIGMTPLIIPLDFGKATIKVTSDYYEGVSTTFEVEVTSALEQLLVEPGFAEVWMAGDDETEFTGALGIPDYIVAEDAAELDCSGYTVESSDPEVVRVDELETPGDFGPYRFVAVGKGNANLIYTSIYNPEIQFYAEIMVMKEPQRIELLTVAGQDVSNDVEDVPTVTLKVGQTYTATAQVTPADADYSDFIMRYVDPKSPLEDPTLWFEEVSSNIENGVLTYEFKVKAVPDMQVAIAPYLVYTKLGEEYENSLIGNYAFLNVIVAVESIEAPEEMTLWIDETDDVTDVFDYPVTITPTNANPELQFTIQPMDQSLWVSMNQDENGTPFYQIHVSRKPEGGAAQIIVSSYTNEELDPVVTNLQIKQKVTSMNFAEKDEQVVAYNDGQQVFLPAIQYQPENADFDPAKVSYSISRGRLIPQMPEDWTPATLLKDEETGNASLIGRAICSNMLIEAVYDDAEQNGTETSCNNLSATYTTKVLEKVQLSEGWNWISLISGEVQPNEVEGLEEARSQTQMGINDPSWGWFGRLSSIATGEAYKLDANNDVDVVVAYNAESYLDIQPREVNAGWNWVGYPYEYPYALDDVFTASSLAEGDVLLSKSGGMATVVNGAWEGTLETLTPGEGYMLKHAGNGTTLTLKDRYELPQGYWNAPEMERARAMKRAASVWSYDTRRFANTMAIIAKLDVENAEEYSIGAFVGEECRGEGKVVNGKAYITLGGEAGESVSFRLYNDFTGAYSEVATQLSFADMAGSVQEPVALKVPVQTSIDMANANGQQIYFNGNVLVLGNYDGIASVMTLDGKLVAKTSDDTVTLDGLSDGIYVVVIETAQGRVVRKISKN